MYIQRLSPLCCDSRPPGFVMCAVSFWIFLIPTTSVLLDGRVRDFVEESLLLPSVTILLLSSSGGRDWSCFFHILVYQINADLQK